MVNSLLESKQDLRERFKAERLNQSSKDCIRKSNNIMDQIRNLKIYQESNIVAIYNPIYNEVDLLNLTNDNKTFCFPKIINMKSFDMEFFEMGDGFAESIYGIWEPKGRNIPKDNIDLILVPGVVFSKDGYRIGYGKGFYDKYLNGFRKTSIGIAYDFQIIDSIPHGELDQKLSMIIFSGG